MDNTAEKKYTAEQYYAMTGETNRPMELHNGVIVDLAAPSIKHQRIVGGLYSRILQIISGKGGGCEPFISPTDVKLDDYTVVQPDVFVVCDKNKIDEKRINGAPDLVVEVTSENRNIDLVTKLEMYSRFGVREYWIVDLKFERVLVYSFESGDYPMIYSFADEAPVGIYGGELSIKISELTA